MAHNKKKYTAGNFVVDATLTFVTGGIWLVWIFCREMRSK